MLVTLGLSLGACEQASEAWQRLWEDPATLLPSNQHFSSEAMTWDEWVAHEAPRRDPNVFDPYYQSGRSFPNITQWTPEDFLPAEMFKQEFRDLRELPPFERSRLRGFADQMYHIDVYQVLEWAKQGYPEAQSALGDLCYSKKEQFVKGADGEYTPLPDDQKPVSMREALTWAQRAAASGNAFAQYRLAQCMYSISRIALQSPEVLEANKIVLDPFWYDQVFYWKEKGLEGALFDKPLGDRTRHELFSIERGNPRRHIETYKWSRLWELQAGFRRWIEYGINREYTDRQGLKAWWFPKMPKHHQAQAEKEVEQ